MSIQLKASKRLSAFVISEKDAIALLKELGIHVGKTVRKGGHYTTFQISADDAVKYAALLTKKFGRPRDAGFGAAKVQQWHFDSDSDDSICINQPNRSHPFPTIEVIGT